MRHDFGKTEVFTLTEVATAIPELNSKKRCDEDKIRPEMLKALNEKEVRWLTSLCDVAWRLNWKKLNDRQIGLRFQYFLEQIAAVKK